MVRGSDPGIRGNLTELLQRKYGGMKFDFVVAVNPAATAFVLEDGAFLARGAPILSLYPGRAIPGSPKRRVGLIGSIFDFEGTLRLALGLKPNARRVLLVTGSGPSDRMYEEQAWKSFDPWKGRLTFETTGGLAFPEILKRVSEAGDDTIVIYSTIFADGTGAGFIPKEAAMKVSAVSRQPVFGTYEPLLGTGVVGGSMLSISENGRQIARMALGALHGKNPIPGDRQVFEFPNRPLPLFTWPELNRYGLDPGRLPAGAIILQRPPSPWAQYKSAILSALAVMVVLVASTLGMAIQNRRRKEAERSAREKQKWVQILIDESPDAIAVYDADRQRCVDANPAAEVLFGCTRQELLRLGPEHFFATPQPDREEGRRSIAMTVQRALSGERFTFQSNILSTDGRRVPCQVHLTRLPTQDRQLLRVNYVDLSGLRQAEADLHRSQANLRALIENTADVIWSVDLGFRVITFNQATADLIQKMHGRAIGIGMSLAEILPPERADQWGRFYERVLSEGAHRQESLVLPDGRSLELSFNPIRQDGVIVGVSVFGKDITEQKRLREQLYQSQKMDAVGQLAGGVAHDFNNALAGITNAAELLRGKELSPDQRHMFAEMILTAAQRAGGLTRKLLAFSRKAEKSSTPVDVATIVDDVAAILRSTLDKRIGILVETQVSGTKVIGDDALLQNAFLNMGINAGHAMPEGGTLTFRLEETSLDEAYCAHAPFDLEPGRFLRVTVQDTGCGMPPETVARIFEPFFTTRRPGEGTGLGLSAVYGTVQDHHGALQVYSEPGRGTAFHVYLPLAAEMKVAPAAEASVESGQGTILLIDDEELIRITGKAILERLGYTVITAEDGAVGLSILAERPGEIQLIILDMIMPVLGGRDTLHRIREIDRSVPVLICSGFSKDGELAGMRGEEVFGFLHKPFRRTELAAAVAEAFRSAAG
nr:PAS domain S-box protein [uncultured Holophaga sp.]